MVESPHEPNTIYVGSDDGLVHITQDGGESWIDITPKGLPETIINSIDVSPHDKEQFTLQQQDINLMIRLLDCINPQTMANLGKILQVIYLMVPILELYERMIKEKGFLWQELN